MTTIEINDISLKIWTDNSDEIPMMLRYAAERFEHMRRNGLKDAFYWDFRPDSEAKILSEAEKKDGEG